MAALKYVQVKAKSTQHPLIQPSMHPFIQYLERLLHVAPEHPLLGTEDVLETRGAGTLPCIQLDKAIHGDRHQNPHKRSGAALLLHLHQHL